MKLKQSLLSLVVAGMPLAAASASPWPTSTEDNAVTSTNQSISIDVLANDVGEGLTLTKVNDWSVNGGRATINADGTSVTYTPRADYEGSDVFWYDFQDSEGRTNAAKVNIRIEGDVTEQPDAWPTAQEDFIHIKSGNSYYVSYQTVDVLANDVGVGLTITSVNEWTRNGNIVSVSDDGKTLNFRVFRPQSEWPMLDEFWYVFEDNWGRKNAGKVKVLLSTEDKPEAWPTATTDTAQTTTNTPVKIDVLANDTGLGLSIKSVNESSVGWGKIVIDGDELSYTPRTDFEGEDEFWYVFEDAWGRTNSAKVVVNVTEDTTTVIPLALTDTGIVTCGDYAFDNSNNHDDELTDCTAAVDADNDPIPQGQDAVNGLDAIANDDSDGHAGFSYTKLDSAGSPLDASAESWSCVKDNVTGYIWESKQNLGSGIAQSGLHTAEDLFSWYSTDPKINGNQGSGSLNPYNPALCSGYDANDASKLCNTEAFVARVNTATLCGLNNWKLPSLQELSSLVNYNEGDRAIDPTYFPNNTYGSYSTATIGVRGSSSTVMNIAFHDGNIYTNSKSIAASVRLVSKPATATEE